MAAFSFLPKHGLVLFEQTNTYFQIMYDLWLTIHDRTSEPFGRRFSPILQTPTFLVPYETKRCLFSDETDWGDVFPMYWIPTWESAVADLFLLRETKVFTLRFFAPTIDAALNAGSTTITCLSSTASTLLDGASLIHQLRMKLHRDVTTQQNKLWRHNMLVPTPFIEEEWSGMSRGEMFYLLKREKAVPK